MDLKGGSMLHTPWEYFTFFSMDIAWSAVLFCFNAPFQIGAKGKPPSGRGLKGAGEERKRKLLL